MILSREYQDKFNNLKQRFGCTDRELEVLLRESHKSTSGIRAASIESLIDQQLNEIDAPRGRKIYGIDWEYEEPTSHRRRKILKEENGRLNNWEIREIFDANRPFDPAFRRLNRLVNFRQSSNFRKKVERHRRLNKLRQIFHNIKHEGRRELLRESKRIGRNAIRRQARGLVSHYF